jgi:glycosyltransferase involved in cell wall biosynthesis
MDLLFIGTTLSAEHIFTQNVWYSIKENFDAYYCTLYYKNPPNDETILYDTDERIISIFIPESIHNDQNKCINFLSEQFTVLQPKIIHSNLTKCTDIEAAKLANIPIVKTMHIGGLVCPRSEVNGFLRWDETICNLTVGKQCNKCCCYELPLPKIAYAIDRMTPNWLKNRLDSYLSNKQFFYFSQLFSINRIIRQKLNSIEALRHATVIAGNNHLSNQLASMGIPTKVIKNGIRSFSRLPYPQICQNSKIKFFFLGRIQYSKGLHILLKALNGISSDLYELHVFGDASESRHEQRYKNKILRLSKGKNVFFHGFINNEQLPSVLKDMHVMIHSTICHEVYGLTISEALSMGKPVLSTKCCGSEMQVIDGVNGWLIEPNNSKALHEQIMAIIRNKSKLPNLSVNCKCPETLDKYISELRELYCNFANLD